ncbi:hypothetical protein DWV22_05680 [Weissella confusa]|uniref:hypothetical protein n=1 Tax=Weissella confusa TaxID=1583 RepID=UPI000989A3E1|nr:hypothetical protein [Weissella confusa]MBF7057155.1 hypothetical protein [Weissella confusa]MBJ7620905.1 hypothetical protein [Weissella confusa]MBJ7667535.1 hypothetical protein [Weissella confusa]MBJ7678230.1 hypothetical protein [Weissella confusa]MBJ7682993.1 hypothetical protein [Weissella confusa]
MYYVVLTDFRNVGMLVQVSNESAKVFTYKDGWVAFNFSPYIDSDDLDVADEYREVSNEEKNRLINERGIVDGSDAYNWL